MWEEWNVDEAEANDHIVEIECKIGLIGHFQREMFASGNFGEGSEHGQQLTAGAHWIEANEKCVTGKCGWIKFLLICMFRLILEIG